MTKKNKVIIIGDIILDRDIQTMLIGTSLETPTLKSLYKDTKLNLGGAGRVFKNLKKINSQSLIIGYVSSNNQLKEFSNKKNQIYFFNGDTPIKSRYWIDNYKVLQINKDLKITSNEKNKIRIFLIKKIKRYASKFNSIIISDYNFGVINKILVDEIFKLKNKYKFNVFVDKQKNKDVFDVSLYNNVDYLFLNRLEYESLTKSNFSKNSLKIQYQKFKKKYNISNIIIKLDVDGAILINDQELIHHKNYKKVPENFNTVGAGDIFISVFASSNYLTNNLRLKLAVKESVNFIINNNN
jgi:D-beta-D-heptose 7-phosphate kinase/D-beta-D-heptose 1-phosphate adenosyltransferase